MTKPELIRYEPCAHCRREYQADSAVLCNDHRLCSACHEPDGVTPRSSSDPSGRPAAFETLIGIIEREQGYRCPRCNRVSHHPADIEHHYCGNCHDYTGT